MGEYISTDRSAPAVMLYNSVLALQAIGWVLICSTALKNQLAKNEKAALQIRMNCKFGYFAFALYTFFAIIAIWFPLTIAIVTTFTWIFWLTVGINIKHE
jgi:1,4-dihydroxy-2-naphthoate octaprenyltransferase